jgi:hypothetical protein
VARLSADVIGMISSPLVFGCATIATSGISH